MKPKLDRKMLGIILALAWPTMLEELMQTAVSYIDTAMVGSLGTKATAAVGATGTVNWLICGTVAAMGIGFLSYISQSIGAGDRERARSAAAQSVLCVAVVGIFMTALTVLLSPYIPVWMRADESIRADASLYFMIIYAPMLFRTASIMFGTVLRASGDTKTPMKIGLLVNGINILMNVILIYPTRTVGGLRLYGAGLGVKGAALASAISFVTGGILVSRAFFLSPLISPRGCDFRPNGTILGACFSVAVPNMLQRFATCMGYVVFASMINALGDLSTAAHTVANTVESLFYIPGYGMQSAAGTLAGNAKGAGDERRLRSLTVMFIPLEITLMIVSGALLFALAPSLLRLFSSDDRLIALGSTVLRMVAVSEPFFGVTIVLEGIMQGLGRTKEPFLFNVLGMWCIRIVGTFICTRMLGFGLVSAWACMVGHNLLLFVLYICKFALGNILSLDNKANA